MSYSSTTYKDSPLGKIPVDWEVKFYGEVANFLNGKAYKQDELLTNGKYKVLRVGNFFTNSDWYYSDLELEDDKYVFDGDLMYAWSASFGPRYWNGNKTIFHYHIWKVLPTDLINKDFLYFFLGFDAEKILSSKQGGTMSHITKGDMEKRKILLPGLNEQRAIATCLCNFDETITKTNQLITQKELRKKWLMQQLLTGKKRLKGFGGEWKEVKIGDVFEEIKETNDGGGSHSIMTISSKLGLISQQDKFDRVIAGDSLKKYTQLKMGDFAYNKGNSKTYPMGCVYQLEEYQSALVPFVYICFKPSEKISSLFYKQWFNAHGLDRQLQRIITSGARGDGLLNVNSDDFFKLKIPLPPKGEQTAIANVLQAADKEIQLLKAKAEKLKEEKKGMMQVLLTGKKRLKIS